MPDYPESSHRTVLADPRPSGGPSARPPQWSRAQQLYTIESEPAPAVDRAIFLPSPRSPSPAENIKPEPSDPDSDFIFELEPASPPPTDPDHLSSCTEVPLRATNASPAMRKMMSVFRLHPFAVHNGRGAAVAAVPLVDVGPLTEEPIMVEFQVYLPYPLVPQSPEPDDDRPQYTRQRMHAREQPPAWLRSPSPASSTYPDPSDAHEDQRNWRFADADLPYPSSPVESPPFAPLMTPAQSLHWSMRYGVDGTIPFPTPAEAQGELHYPPTRQRC
uniref:Uncharacterized protein n=1 Tax=Sparassis latifolia TaxID=1202976 RepID=A0A6B9LTG1_9APHY|nr:hypothetical protein [Sparassis latifolia]